MRNLSVFRPSSVRVAIMSEPNARVSLKFWLSLSLGHRLGRTYIDCFLLFAKILFFVFVNMDPMGAIMSKLYSCYKSQPNVFKNFLNFRRNGPLWDF